MDLLDTALLLTRLMGLLNTMGEMVYEDKILPGAEESAELSTEDHSSEKDGIVTPLLAATAVEAQCSRLTGGIGLMSKDHSLHLFIIGIANRLGGAS